MLFQEKRTSILFLGGLVLAAVFMLITFGRVADAPAGAADSLRFWALTILVLVPVMIASKIVLYIFAYIVHAAATREQGPDKEDEMDKLIGLKAVRNSSTTFGLVFLAFLGALALDWPVRTAFPILLGGMFLSDLVSEATQFFYYRRGF